MQQVRKIKKGAEVELRLEKFADRGKSMARVDGYVVFVDGAVPGDLVRARIVRRKNQYAVARVLDVLEPSTLRVQPKCVYFGSCGGCKWQHVDYQSQLEAKRSSVADALEHVAGIADVPVSPTIPANAQYYYRNKMEFSFSATRWMTADEIASGEPVDRSFALGLHAPGSYDKVLDLKECHLQSEWSAGLVNRIRSVALEQDWSPWDVRSHTGYLRHVVVRQSRQTDECLVNVVTSSDKQERMHVLASKIRETHPELTTLVNTINRGTGQTAIGDECLTVFGPGVIHERIGRFLFQISAGSFFQTNTEQAGKLYDLIVQMADFRPGDVVYDLYCGAGTIAIYIAEHVARVVGIELVPEAVDNARHNAKINDVDNCHFVQGDALRLFDDELVRSNGTPRVLIVDPPRAGLHKKVVRQIAGMRPERLIYVSCNPQTMSRDIGLLTESYQVDRVQPIDLFPQTHHTEAVARLTSK